MKSFLTCASVIAGCTLALGVVADEVKLHGAVTTVDVLIKPTQEAVEKATGLTLAVVGNSAGKGLIDLAEGNCDGALTAADLTATVSAAKKAGKEVDPATLTFTEIVKDEIIFFVNPANPVKKLTLAQVKGIYTGTITNWKDVGGEDSPIMCVTDKPNTATSAAIQSMVLGGQDYGAGCKPQPTVKQISLRVAEFKAAFGGASAALVDKAKVQVVETEKKIERPLAVITKGEPSGNVQKVIKALKDEAAKTK